MRHFLVLIFSILFTLQTTAEILGKSTDGSLFDRIERMQVPPGQLTKLADKQYLVETGNGNRLKNANFLATGAATGWTVTTATAVADDTFYFTPNKSLQLTLPSGTQTNLVFLSQTYTANAGDLAGSNLEISIRIAKSLFLSLVNMQFCLDVDSVNVSCKAIPNTTAATYFEQYSFNYPAKQSSAPVAYKVYLKASYVTVSTAAIINVQDAYLGPARNIGASPYISTAWTSWTPTFTGLGTVTSVALQYRQEGPNMLIKGRFTCGTPTATQAGFSLPNGALPATDIGWQTTGMYWKSATSADKGGPLLYLTNPANNFLFFGPVTTVGSTSADPTNAVNGTVVCGAGQTVILSGVSIPIAGWENNAVNVVTPANWNFDWRDCPSGFSHSWTGGTFKCKYKRVGGQGYFDYSFTSSGAQTGTETIGLPPGLTFDLSRMTNGDMNTISASLNDNGVQGYQGGIIRNSTNTVLLITMGASGNFTTTQSVLGNSPQPFVWGSGDTYQVTFNAPIVENGVPWTETWNAMQLNGSVTVGGTTQVQKAFRFESFFFGGASISTVCSTPSSACTIYKPSTPGIFTVTRNTGVGSYTVGFPSGTFGDGYGCTGSFSNNSNTIAHLMQGFSPTGFTVAVSSVSAGVDVFGFIMCFGPAY